MSFNFSLQRVLDLREREVEDIQKKQEFIKQSIFKLRGLIEKERDFYFSDRDELNQYIEHGKLEQVPLYEGSLKLRQKRIMQLLEGIRSLQSDLDLSQQNLIQAKRNKKVLENLRQLREKEYINRIEKMEQAQMDELALQKFLRGQRLNDYEN